MRHTDFQFASGQVIGRDHRQVPKNCQDGYHIAHSNDYTVAIVTDGCGSDRSAEAMWDLNGQTQHNEVGAKLGAVLAAQAVLRAAIERGVDRLNWSEVQFNLASQLYQLARSMGGNIRETIESFFLFTIVGVLLSAETATFFALGDGVVVVNGEVSSIGPFPGNKPPYIGYSAIPGSALEIEPGDLAFRIVASIPLEFLDSFLIGCDGVDDLIKVAEHRLPGLSDTVGGIEQFWCGDAYFTNPALLSRRLKLIGRDWPKANPSPGLLPDDTTLIVGRRKP